MTVKKKRTEHVLGSDDIISNVLLDNHIHFIVGEICEESVEKAIKWIVFENTLSETNTLTLYINSPGGSIEDAFALIDVMRASKCPIRTIGMGVVASAAFMVFVSGTKGQRYVGKNASLMCHQFSGEASGKYHDLKSYIRESDFVNSRMSGILSESTELTPREIKSKLLNATDVWLTPDEAVKLGVANHIL